MTTAFRRLACLAVAAAVVPFAAGPASAAPAKHIHHAKHTVKAVKPVVKASVAAPVVTATPAPTPAAAPTVNSVISIGGYVFYGLTYPEAVAAYQAAVAANPGYTPPPVTSVSVSTTVGGTAG
jgi:hypothetical protein